MSICVVGTGYVGLVTGACLSDFGMKVMCVDNNRGKIEDLKRGVMPVHEAGLEDLVRKNTEMGHLHFTDDLKQGVERSQVIFIAVGTPPLDDGEVDLSNLEVVAKDIAHFMDDYKVIVIKSTVPVGTAKRVRIMVRENQKRSVEFDVVSNPEFLREGCSVKDFMHPQRVILGTLSQRALDTLKGIYSPFYRNRTHFVICTNETAEMIKYASNSFLATKVSFVNEIANICERLGVDIKEVTQAMALDKRIGAEFLSPGPGFGGSCLPKDLWALTKIAARSGYDFKLGKCVMEANRRQKEAVVFKAKRLLGSLEQKTVGILGLSFKANTDDIRESPSVVVIQKVLEENADVRVFDPAAVNEAKKLFPTIYYGADPYDVARGCDCLIVLTEWKQFKELDWENMKSSMRSPNLVDTRNICDPLKMRSMGFNYLGAGR